MHIGVRINCFSALLCKYEEVFYTKPKRLWGVTESKAVENPGFITVEYFNLTANGKTLGKDKKKWNNACSKIVAK